MVPTVNAAGEEAMEACHGLTLVGADDIDDDTAAAIAEISDGREGLKVKLHDKKGALVDIGRHLGMFRDKVEHFGEIKMPELKLILHGTKPTSGQSRTNRSLWARPFAPWWAEVVAPGDTDVLYIIQIRGL